MVEVEYQLLVRAAVGWKCRQGGVVPHTVLNQSLDVTHSVIDSDGRRAVVVSARG